MADDERESTSIPETPRQARKRLARELSQQHPDLESFEAAGGDVDELPLGFVDTGESSVVASPVGGETPLEAKKSWEDKQDQHLSGIYKEQDKTYDTINKIDLSHGGNEHTQVDVLKRLFDLEAQGQIQLSPNFRRDAEAAVQALERSLAAMKEEGVYGDVLQSKRAIEHDRSLMDALGRRDDLIEEFLSDRTRPYREEGSE